MKNFLSIEDCSDDQLAELLSLTAELKKLYKSGGQDLSLAGKTLVMLFEKPSLRTRISFQVAMTNLGGATIYVKPEDIGGIGKREPVKDTSRVLSRYSDGIMARTFAHETIVELAQYATVPVINALSDWSHPCQAMADVVTIKKHVGRLQRFRGTRLTNRRWMKSSSPWLNRLHPANLLPFLRHALLWSYLKKILILLNG